MDTSKIARYVWIGKKDQFWYHECERCFVDLFGTENLELVCKLFAATSINTSLKANITLFRKAFHEIQNGLPIGNYLPNIQNQLEKIRSGEDLSGRKISSFAKAMSGNKESVVVDVWLLRAFNMDRKTLRHTGPHAGLYRSGGATDKQYSLIESYVRDEAKSMKIEPRSLSAMIWSGVRIDQSGDTNTHYQDILRSHFHNLFDFRIK